MSRPPPVTVCVWYDTKTKLITCKPDPIPIEPGVTEVIHWVRADGQTFKFRDVRPDGNPSCFSNKQVTDTDMWVTDMNGVTMDYPYCIVTDDDGKCHRSRIIGPGGPTIRNK